MTEINTIHQAKDFVCKAFGLAVTGTHDGSSGVIAYWLHKKDERYVMCFKRDFLHSFDYLFPEWEKGKRQGYGQTMNLDLLKEAAAQDAVVLIVMPKSVVYEISAAKWLRLAKEHGSIRVPKREDEQEASIPAKCLTRRQT